MTTKQVSGHRLRDEGAAFDDRKEGRPVRVRWNSTAGEGFGLCSCGARSDFVSSGAQRKAWHRAHKDDVVAGRWRP